MLDTSGYRQVASIGYSENIFEVRYKNGTIEQVGDQYGVGRNLISPLVLD
ncbi:MAG: hypothetical protein H7318_04485 [Oligoflexus sp.]|nr:hypothetical protein [Oligoflexus sp.]